MIRSLRFVAALVCYSILSSASPQIQDAGSSEAQRLMARALALADLYNWADAAPFFQQAQMLFERTGDKRNALHARLGFIRANIERQQETLPTVSHDLKIELEDNPLLQSDRRLRLFAFIVKGDIDTETDTAAMREGWRQVQALAQELGEAKWSYRALAQLGIAAFYDGDTETARRSAGEALALAKEAKDVGAQIRILTILGRGLVATKAFGQSLPLLENALLLAGAVPDSGFQFTAQEVRIEALIGLKQYERAQQLTDETLNAARRDGRMAHEATLLGLSARIAAASGNTANAVTILDSAISKGEQIGLVRVLAQLYALAAEINRQLGNLARAEEHLARAARATQVSGDIWAVPQRLLILADLRRARGQYREADEVYDRAEMFVDSMIGKASTVFEKAALIRSASELYTKHISLVADHFQDADKVYGIVEQVRGRIAADQLAAGTVTTPEAKRTERQIARLRLQLMKAQSTSEIRRLRDEIFFTEQARWVDPGVSILKRRSSSPVSLNVVQLSLAPETTVLEYVAAEPSSYCLVITRSSARVVPLAGKLRLEKLASSYLTKVKARQTGLQESKSLYAELIRPLNLRKASRIVVIRDGPLHLLPFGAFRQASGRYLVQRSIVTYAPSVTSHHLLTQETVTGRSRALLGVGGVGYGRSGMNTVGLARGNERFRFSELPSSTEEIAAAAKTLRSPETKVLTGNRATESAFKQADLESFGVIHLAVHGFADQTNPERAALVLLSDPAEGEDGFLYSSEVAQLRLSAALVVLSACDSAVGPLQGQEGIANLSRAFLLAGAKSVVSTSWPTDDASSSLLMKRFYAHLANRRAPDEALTAAKRDVLKKYGARALPYYWAGFVIEGGGPRTEVQPRRIGDTIEQSKESKTTAVQH